MTFRIPTLAVILWCVLLAGCTGSERLAGESAAPSAPPDGAGAAGIAPPFSLAGRWTLSSAGTGSCAMTFGAGQDLTEGTIAPAGGCPFNFFTSRKWTYSAAGLTIPSPRSRPNPRPHLRISFDHFHSFLSISTAFAPEMTESSGQN